MPNSCRSILTRLLRSKRIKQWEHDKLLRNLKGIEWHPYPQEKPSKSGYYLVTTDGIHNDVIDIAWFDAIMAGLLQWNKASEILAWAELPEPYEEVAEE